MASNQDTLRDTEQLNQALEETRWKMSQLGSDTVRVQNDVSNAMSRVTGQLRQLGNTMVPVANVGLNLFSRLLRVLQPLADSIKDEVGRSEVHVGDPHREDVGRRFLVPLHRVGSPARDQLIEIVFCHIGMHFIYKDTKKSDGIKTELRAVR